MTNKNSVWVRSFASEPVECSITNAGGGDPAWFTLPANYDSYNASHWSRTGWQTIAFRSKSCTTTQCGFYKEFDKDTTYVTFFDFGCDGTAFTNKKPVH